MSVFHIYAIRARTDEIIYVGMSSHLDDRIASHRLNQPWRDEIHHHEVIGSHVDERNARDAERWAIERYRPKYNVQHNPDVPTANAGRIDRAALTKLRERSGHSKSSLAERAGVDRTLVHRLENGQRNATPTVMRKLADALDCPLHALMGPSDDEAAA